MKILTSRTSLLIIAAISAFVLLSPKWTVLAAAWVAPAFLLQLLKDRTTGRSFLLAFVVLYVSGVIANYKVIPFPTPFLFVMGVQFAVVGAIPYVCWVILSKKIPAVHATYAFPVVMVAYEFLNSMGGGGTWGVIANTQVDNLVLVQIASITGVWGISFLIYWFNALVVYCLNTINQLSAVRQPVIIYTTVIAFVLAFGTAKLHWNTDSTNVRVAAITAVNIEPALMIYQDVFNKKLDVDPAALTQTSPELQELNKALLVFIEKPMDSRFRMSHRALVRFQDSLFNIAAHEAKAGAKVIVFSEALMFTVKPVESELIERGRSFARAHNVRLLLPLGTLIPGKVEPGSKYIENKVVSISERGDVDFSFFKNKPVPMVEGSVLGDGKIPVISTSFGNLGASICYDADFPALIRQAGKQRADILFLPSGDWREIDFFHANMARLRAIENGFSLVRPVSGATSIASDYNGRVIGSSDFYAHGEHVMVANIPTSGIKTLYSVLGDFLPIGCLILVVVALAFGATQSLLNRFRLRTT